jgi:hypothetical protein
MEINIGDRVKVKHLGKFYAARVSASQPSRQIWTTVLESTGRLVIAWDAEDIARIKEKAA